MSDDHAVKLTDNGPHAWSSLEYSASRDDPYIRGIGEDLADHLVENWSFERVETAEATSEPTISEVEGVMSGTLTELQDALETGDYDIHLDLLEEYEREHKNRDGAYERINRRRDN